MFQEDQMQAQNEMRAYFEKSIDALKVRFLAFKKTWMNQLDWTLLQEDYKMQMSVIQLHGENELNTYKVG